MRKGAASLFLSLAGAAEQPDELVTDMDDATQANLVGLADLFKRPANAHVARQARATIGRPLKGGDDDGHRETPLRFASVASSTSVTNSSGCSAATSRDRNASDDLLVSRSGPYA